MYARRFSMFQWSTAQLLSEISRHKWGLPHASQIFHLVTRNLPLPLVLFLIFGVFIVVDSHGEIQPPPELPFDDSSASASVILDISAEGGDTVEGTGRKMEALQHETGWKCRQMPHPRSGLRAGMIAPQSARCHRHRLRLLHSRLRLVKIRQKDHKP